jgi:hypothetical protein
MAYCPRSIVSDIATTQDSIALFCVLANTLHYSSDYCPFLHSRQLALMCYIRLREISLRLMAIFKLRPLRIFRHYSPHPLPSWRWIHLSHAQGYCHKPHKHYLCSDIHINNQHSTLSQLHFDKLLLSMSEVSKVI